MKPQGRRRFRAGVEEGGPGLDGVRRGGRRGGKGGGRRGEQGEKGGCWGLGLRRIPVGERGVEGREEVSRVLKRVGECWKGSARRGSNGQKH